MPDLSHLTLGERIVTLARLAAAEHIRQELAELLEGEHPTLRLPAEIDSPFADDLHIREAA